jgi:transposase
MPVVGGLDIHRKQLTFDYVDTVSGEVMRGQIVPADREHLRAWLAQFAGRDDVGLAVEGCTGWRYAAEELAAAGVAAHVGEPADTAAARGRKRHAKTDKTDCRHLRQLLAEGRLPGCWVPPPHILECRALLETYHDLRAEHTAQAQLRGLLPPGRPAARRGVVAHRAGRGRAAGSLGRPPVCGRAVPDRHRPGRDRGPGNPAPRRAAPAAGGCREPGRGQSARQGGPVHRRDITVYSSDGKRAPGRLSRQGPPVLRWAVYEAGKAHARASAPTTATTPPSPTARTASAPPCPRPARSSGKPVTSWPSSATAPAPPEPPAVVAGTMTHRAQAGAPQPHSPDGEPPRPAPACRLPAAPGAFAPGRADGLIRLSGRTRSARDTRSIIMSPGPRQSPAHPGKAGCPRPAPGRHGRPPRTARTANQADNPPTPCPDPPCPRSPGMIRSRAARVKGACGAATAGPRRALRAP